MSWLCVLASLVAAAPCATDGTAFPKVRLEKVGTGFKNPVHFADGWVVEQAGRIVPLKGGEPLLDITERVRSGGEMGLLSVAFHPKDPKRFYVNYTAGRGRNLRTEVVEFSPKGERLLFKHPQPYTNHNGGQLAFGPDGLLYIGMGDGGSGNDPHDHAQRDDSLLGKMLALDVDKPGKPQVFAKGLRNPWRFSFDPVTGKLWAADVGQDAWEEIDVIERGGNYGWRVMEGNHCNEAVKDRCDPRLYKAPVHEYARKDGISVTGGFVYRGDKIKGLCGAYLFSDYGSGFLWGLRLSPKRHAVLLDTGLNVTSFGVDRDHEVYVTSMDGDVYKLAAE